MSWPVHFDEQRIDLWVRERISESDAERQTATAREILARLERQPGVVLADEVGMGKTFVALSVAAMTAWQDKKRRPVVVMVPPALKDKWPRDFEVFVNRCVKSGRSRRPGLRAGRAPDAVTFFRYLDDPTSRRPQVIFLTHGALHHGLQDPWTKLAILKRALSSSRLTEQRRVFPRFAARLLRNVHRGGNEDLYADLMVRQTRQWRAIMQRHQADPGDDPVPEAIDRVLRETKVDLTGLRDALGRMPLRHSRHLAERLTNTRRALTIVMREVWANALVEAKFESPLLILDEAHHLKNPATRLASLFVEPDAEHDSRLLDGALKQRFERMLFLTATPFQLGHHELLNVLDRFRGINWRRTKIATTPEQHQIGMKGLRETLDQAQHAAVALDKKWKLLDRDDVAGDPEDPETLESWWSGVVADREDQGEKVSIVLRSYEGTSEAMRLASRALRPWVIRHRRDRMLPGTTVARRNVYPGDAILNEDSGALGGLEIRDHSVLPFLLGARCQTIVHRLGDRSQSVAGRITFAEGLASSYEAFLETRAMVERRDLETEVLDEDETHPVDGATSGRRFDWYFRQLEKALPGRGAFGGHPKVAPTRDRAIELWAAGEKVLVFCHFRKTGMALARHLSDALDAHLLDQAVSRLGCSRDEVESRLAAIGDRFELGRPFTRSLRAALDTMFETIGGLEQIERDRVFEVVRRFVRTPSFLIRFFPLGEAEDAALLALALNRADRSGLSLRSKIGSFVAFLAKRCSPEERGEYLDALEGIMTGERWGGGAGERFGLQPNVRLANGETGSAERRRLLVTFNTPFFPEILVASSVMAEGVDLHLDCRHVIHHDLCWNPSTLEQRTGRIDRIGAKAERVGCPIHVYLPFVAGTQDEKMYRIVRDRERWFQVLMGENYALDETNTERLAERIPLPEAAARGLAMRLEVWSGESDHPTPTEAST